MSKVFSMVVFLLNEILHSTGLIKSSPAIISTQGTRKFQMNVNQMLELYYLFRAPSVIKNLFVL